MAAHTKKARLLARQLFKMSVVDGVVSPDRVAGVLQYIEAHRPANPIIVLKTYRHLIETELQKSHAVVEHAGALSSEALNSIAGTLSRKYGRAVTTEARPNPELLAGLRIHVGDDIYESSVAGQLAALSSAV